MSYFPETYSLSKKITKVELDLPNNAKSDWKRAIGIKRSKSAKKADLACLKSDVDWLEINKFDTTPVDLSKRKSGISCYSIKSFVFLMLFL